jgi:hypothetical protein
VWDFEQLFRSLSKLIDLDFQRGALDTVLYTNSFQVPLITHRVENVVRLYSIFTPLLIPKDQVNPVVEVFRNILAFQGLSMDLEEVCGVMSPSR